MADAAWLWVLSGPNGSGKSSLARSGALRAWNGVIPEFAQTPDDIVRVLPDVVPGASPTGYLRAAQEASDSLVRNAVVERRTVMVETVGSSRKSLAVIDDAHRAGLLFGLVYVVLALPDLHVARVAQRVSAGGLPVPEDAIRERRRRSIALFPEFARVADAGLVIDNSHVVAGTNRPKPRLLAEKRRGDPWQVTDSWTAPQLTDAL